MSLEQRTNIKGISRFVFAPGADNEALRMHISEVGPGQRSHDPHTHDGQEIFYVLGGTGEVSVGDDTALIGAGEALQVDCTVLHGIRNAGDDPLRYAVIIAKPSP